MGFGDEVDAEDAGEWAGDGLSVGNVKVGTFSDVEAEAEVEAGEEDSEDDRKGGFDAGLNEVLYGGI